MNARKLLPLLVLLAAVTCSSGDSTEASEEESQQPPELILVDSNEHDFYSSYFPDEEGNPQTGYIQGEGYFVPATVVNVTFKLYTKGGPEEGELLTIGDAGLLRGSRFNNSRTTFIIAHGYLSGVNSNLIQTIKNNYVNYKDGNVVLVDWSQVAANRLYFIAKRQTVPVGGVVAKFVTFLVRSGGMDLTKVHLIGHSLGAHAMGIAGKGVFRKLNAKVDRITGLDPSGPLYTSANLGLNRKSAEFVDVIHTCKGHLGIREAIGHMDFYPNGGMSIQDGCPVDSGGRRGSSCSHLRAMSYFAESIPENSLNFTSVAASSYIKYMRRDRNTPPAFTVNMGHGVQRIPGKYFLDTARSSPFALGDAILRPKTDEPKSSEEW